MNKVRGFGAVVLLLRSKKYRWVVLLPLLIIVAFSAYSIGSEALGQRPDKIVMNDGTVRYHKNMVMAPLKLPKEAGDLQDFSVDGLEIESYDIMMNEDQTVSSMEIYARAVKNLDEIVADYQTAYGLDDALTGTVKGYRISLNPMQSINKLSISFSRK